MLEGAREVKSSAFADSLIANMDRAIGDEQRKGHELVKEVVSADLIKQVETTQYSRFSVGALMTRGVVSVPGDAPLADTIHLMRRRGITSVVVEPNAAGEWGIMTMRDVLEKVVRDDRQIAGLTVDEIATHPLLTITPEKTLAECAALMIERHIRRVVVTKQEQPLGIISETDIFRYMEERSYAQEQE